VLPATGEENPHDTAIIGKKKKSIKGDYSMALAGTGKTLGKSIAEKITVSEASPEIKAEIVKVWEKIGDEIIKHIIANAEVASGIPVSTTGLPAAQTGATTASGKLI
jgi:hypothetical protein